MFPLDRIDAFMNFLGGFPDQKQATGDQDQVPPRKGMVKGGEQRLGQLDDIGDRPEQREAQAQRQTNADPARLWAHLLGQLVGQDRYEDQIVDAEHQLHRNQGDEGSPGCGLGEQCDEFGHGRDIWPVPDFAARGNASSP